MFVIIGLYVVGVYLVFFKFRLLPLNVITKTLIIVLGVFIYLTVITGLRTKTPASVQAAVTTYITEIAPQVNGRVDQVLVERNEVVEAGTVLFTIDPTLYQSQVDALEASLELSRLRLAQFEELASADAASRFQYQQTEAETRTLEAQLAGAQFNLDNCEVRAPSRGMVPRLFLQPGQQVSPGRSVMTFMNTETMYVVALLPQAALQNARVGDLAMISFPALPGRLFESTVAIIPGAIGEGQLIATGQLNRVGAYQGTGLYPIAITLPDEVPEEIRKPGVSAVVYVHTRDAGAMSGVAKALHWVKASLALLV